MSLVAVCDPSPSQVIRSDLDLDSITGKDPDPVHAHLTGTVCKDLMAVLELDPEHGVRKGFDNRALQDDRLLLGL